METYRDLPVLLFASQKDWQTWLHANHDKSPGVWLKHAKKLSGKESVSYQEALEEALCYGWIDSQKQACDDAYYLQKFSPRGLKSVWSKVNVAKVETLTRMGKMQPSGLAAVHLAQQDGRWDAAYDSLRGLTVPKDFQAALKQNPQAERFFATLNKANVYAFCWRVQTAKNPETRLARIEKLINMLNRGEKFH